MYLSLFHLSNIYLLIHPSILWVLFFWRTLTHQFSSVQLLNCVWLFVTPWMPGLPVHHQLPEFTDSYPETTCPGFTSRVRWHIWWCIFLMTTTAVSTFLLLWSSASSPAPQMPSVLVSHWHLTRQSWLPEMSPDWPKVVRQAPFTLLLSPHFPLKRLLETVAYLPLISHWRLTANKKMFFFFFHMLSLNCGFSPKPQMFSYFYGKNIAFSICP